MREVVDTWLPQPGLAEVGIGTVLQALSDPVRLQIVRQLHADGEGSCSTLDVPVKHSTLSHHLRTARSCPRHHQSSNPTNDHRPTGQPATRGSTQGAYGRDYADEDQTKRIQKSFHFLGCETCSGERDATNALDRTPERLRRRSETRRGFEDDYAEFCDDLVHVDRGIRAGQHRPSFAGSSARCAARRGLRPDLHRQVVRCPRRPTRLAGLLDYARSGDIVVVIALDRLGRSLSAAIRTIEQLTETGVLLRSIREGIDYSTPTGRMLAGIFTALAGYERELMHERAAAAREAARLRGRHTGRPPRLNQVHARQVRALRAGGESIAELMRTFGASRATIYRALQAPTNRRSRQRCSEPHRR
jgi:DNA-binding transcriptional ArsR family regulator